METKKKFRNIVFTGAVLMAPAVGLIGNSIAKSIDGTLCQNHNCRYDNETIESNIFQMGSNPSNSHVYLVNSTQVSTGFNGVLEPVNIGLISSPVTLVNSVY